MASANSQRQSLTPGGIPVPFSKLTSGPGIIGLAILAAIILHWLPNLGTPLHSDTGFIFLLQAASQDDQALVSAIPEGLRNISAFPQNPIAGAIDLAQKVERYNIVNFVQFWFTARIGGENADVWRIVPIVFNGAAVGIFICVARRVQISTPVTLVLAGWLLLFPLETWVDYNKSESLGVFFMMAALGAALYSGHWKWAVSSAMLMVAAGLTKEPFLAAWPLVGGAAIYRILLIERSAIARRHITELIPHALGAVFILAIFAILSISGSSEVGYATGNDSGTNLAAFDFLKTYMRNISLVPTSNLSIVLIFGLIAGALLIVVSRKVRQQLSVENGELVFIATLLIGLALHGAIHYGTDRPIAGRYIIPANFEMALLGGIVVSLLMRPIQLNSWKIWAPAVGVGLIGTVATTGDWYLISAVAGVVAAAAVYAWFRANNRTVLHAVIVGGIGIFVIAPLVDTALARAGQNRANQERWQELIVAVSSDAADQARVNLSINDPNMLEMAQSLEAHTLLSGRTDLEYSLTVTDTQRLEAASPYLRRLVEDFNIGRTGMRPSSFNVSMDREGDRSFVPRADQESGLEKIWGKVIDRYGSDKRAFLNFEIASAEE